MKKTKLLMPIIGIAAIGSALAPLTTLTSCNKQGLKVELTNNTALETKLYANTKTLNLFFKQNNTNNVTKTRVKIVNLKINGAEAASVAGLTKISVDSAGGIRVTFNITTMYKHYSNPNSIEFDLLFYNNTNKQSCTVEGFKFNIDQEVEIPHPFEVEDSTVITGFTEEAAKYTAADFARAYPKIFVQITIPVSITKNTKILSNNALSSGKKEETKESEGQAAEEIKTTAIYYSMVIPAKFTEIDDRAFAGDTLPNNIVALDFAANSKMTTIGERSFMASPLIFVTLPESIKTFGKACFAKTQSLTSFRFAPTSKNKLALPEGFLLGTSLQYLKLPNYISSIGVDKGDPSIVVNTTGNGGLSLDLTDWSIDDIKNLNFVKGSIIDNQSYSIAFGSNPETIAAIKAKFVGADSASIFGAAIQPFTYETTAATSTATLSFNDAVYETFIKSLSFITELPMSMFKYPLWRFEFPNSYTENGVTYKIDSFNAKQMRTTFFGATSIEQWLTSLILPNNLKEISESLLTGNPIWQIHIPKSVTTIGAGAFSKCHALNSIVYDGTMSEWKSIELVESPLSWNYYCQEITVTCTDGTITIPASQVAKK